MKNIVNQGIKRFGRSKHEKYFVDEKKKFGPSKQEKYLVYHDTKNIWALKPRKIFWPIITL